MSIIVGKGMLITCSETETEEPTKCYNCGYEGKMDWEWLIVITSTGECYRTTEATMEEFNKDDYEQYEVYTCPKCYCEL